jgi:1-acyl-sn-glycerol-3-phosphate acyltransferase
MSEANQFDLLRTRRFLPLFLTQFANALNDNLYKNALMVFLTLTLSAAEAPPLLNLCAGLFILPFFLFSATAGQLAETIDKARIIRTIKLAEIGIMGVGAAGFVLGQTWMLVAALFLMGVHSTFFGPIKYAILPQHLTRDELIGGNGLIDMGTFLAILLGTILGGAVIASDRGHAIIGAMVIITAIVGYAISRKVPPAPPTAPDLKIDWNPVTATIDCLHIIRGTRSVFLSVLGISWFFMLGATYLTQLPLYVKGTLGGDAGTITALLTVFSVGVGTGSLFCERLSGRTVELGLVPFGALGLIGFGFDLYFAATVPWEGALRPIGVVLADPAIWRVLADLFGIGVFGGFYVVPLFAMLQTRAAPEVRARVIAANNIVNAGCMVLAAVIGIVALGPLGWSVPQVYLLFAILNIPVAIYIFTLLPEFLMRFLVWILTSACYRIERRDLDKIPADGPVLLVCNHVSFVDALIIAGSCRRPVRFVMEAAIYRLPVLNFIFRVAGTVPIASRRSEPAVYEAAFARIAGYLREGEPVCIFPEGKLTGDGEVDEFKGGIARILKETPVPVVPMALSGLWGSMFSYIRGPRLRPWPRRAWARLRLIAGDAIAADAATPEILRAEVAALRGDWR